MEFNFPNYSDDNFRMIHQNVHIERHLQIIFFHAPPGQKQKHHTTGLKVMYKSSIDGKGRMGLGLRVAEFRRSKPMALFGLCFILVMFEAEMQSVLTEYVSHILCFQC